MKLKHIISFILTLALLISVFPTAFAAELPSDPMQSTDATELSNEPPAESDEIASLGIGEVVDDSGFIEMEAEQGLVMVEDLREYAISTFAVKKTATLRNCEQMDFPCTDGNRQGFHYADEDGAAPWDYMNMIYCLENKKSFSYGSGHAGVGELPLDGSGSSHGEEVWYDFTANQRMAIALVMLYGAPTKLWDESWGFNAANDWNLHNPNIGYRFATQAIIWEFAQGLREATPPYKRNSDYWYAKSTGVCMSEDGNTDHFVVAYNSIISDMQQHNTIPSFAGDFAANAPEIALNGNSVTVTDSNGVLSKFDFPSSGGVSYSKNGNNLTITTTDAVPTGVQTATATLPDPAASLYEVWYNQYDSSKQVCIQVSIPASDPVPAYFKLKAATGAASLKKDTEDNKNLGWWKFGFYSDQACTSLLVGPVTSDANGNLTVKDLPAGDVWVKELGHENAAINDLYECGSTNPQKVTIISGQTASVSFYNKLRYGSITFQKATTTGVGVELGWTANLWRVEADGTWTYIGSGTTKQDKSDPTYTFTNLLPGSYILQEAPESAKEGYSLDTTYHSVTVAAGKDTAVTVTNTQLGRGKIIKAMPDGGSTEGRTFDVYRKSDNTFIGSYTTVGNSVITDYILPGEYLVYEQIQEDEIYYCESPNPQTVTVVAGQIAEVTFTNRLKPAQVQVRKTNTEDQPLPGVTLLLEWSEDGISWKPVTYTDSKYVTKGTCTTVGLTDGKLTTDATGIITFTGLHPEMQYRLTEVATADGYQLLADYAYEGGIPLDTLTVSLKIVNTPVFTLPATGSKTLVLMPLSIILALGMCAGAIALINRKERKKVS